MWPRACPAWVLREAELASLLPDQAEGLRRLFAADTRRMVAIVSAGTTANGCATSVGLATALAQMTGSVLLLDEPLAAGDACAAYACTFKHDLNAVLSARCDIEAAIIRGIGGPDLLAGGGGRAASLPRPKIEARIGLVNAFYRLAGRYDVVLVHAGAELLGRHPSFAWACQDVIVLCSGQPDAVTAAYGHIKALHQSGGRRFHLLFEGVAQERAQVLFRNVAAVSRRHLQLMPDFLGVLPQSLPAGYFTQLAEALRSWPLPEHKAGHFPALMRRLLQGVNPQVLQAMALK